MRRPPYEAVMRTSTALAFCLALASSTAALAQDGGTAAPAKGTVAALDAKNGFRDLRFGTELKSIKGLVKLAEQDGHVLYRRPSDIMKVGAAKASLIGYMFVEGKLGIVSLVFEGEENMKRAREAFTAAYGEPEESDDLVPQLHWRGEKVAAVLAPDPLGRSAMLTISCKEAADGIREAQQEAAENADL